MATSLRQAMTAGAWGLSTSQFDVDAHGRPVPSRAADDAEVDALPDVLGAAGHGVVEIVPGLLDVADPFALLEDLTRRCGARGVPLTWTGFTYNETNPQDLREVARIWSDSFAVRASRSSRSCLLGRSTSASAGTPP